ncbi:Glycine betaine/proline betaine transporter BetS [Roseibaca ekhonensis]|uniref:Glycine betaine/proline betaine transporter BetS n=1 Tax=Roseinatronobacter ekhonensis TaxID=254356 RepID=A0A3B0MAU8_9RHOB|nr:BCCT family transporter [Roseibaca ekhonensis]SUZ32520.1 Glycine betaine/proline betaine transporter BetS [Roseibaca ekhonensis]
MSQEDDIEAIPEPEGASEVIETDYEIGQDNITPKIGPFGLDIHNPVFAISGLVVVAFVILTLMFQDSVGPAFSAMRGFLTSTFDWFFLSAANVFVIVCLGILVSPLGKVRIGGLDATPDYSYLGWFAMLFAAGMGIGLMFFGVLEPVYYFGTPWGDNPLGGDLGIVEGALADPETVESARRLAMASTIFHWGLHPWAIYAIVALSLALFAYNKGLPLTVRSIFYPIFGERIWGWPGHIIDILAVFATIFGLSTSLGLGAQQASAGLGFVLGMPDLGASITTSLVLIAIITGMALISVLRGLDGGVKILSEINMGLALLLMVFVLLVGPTLVLLGNVLGNIGAYFSEVVSLSNPVGREDDGFRQGWTAFYWAWWISWSPFVGMFIARVSRGRSVREFITCVLIIPTLASAIWMTTFGGTAIQQLIDNASEAAVFSYVIDSYVPELSLFGMLSELPLASITMVIAIVLVIVFFVTSSDSGSLVIDTITAGGKINAPVSQRVFWVIFEGLVAASLLLGGGLAALQAASVSTGLPFALVLLLACYALIRGLMSEPR